jgi:subtilase family serine protease
VKVDVEEPKYPDLEVGTPTVDETSPQTGATFTLSAVVSNTGDARSAATTLRYYRSTDAAITTSDTEVGTDAVGGLSAGASSGESIGLTAPSSGTYYYGACVDSVSGESNTGNNCSSAVTVTVSAAPDLVVDTPTVSDSSPEVGESFTLAATVENQGSASSGSTTLRYYRSADSTISSSDTAVGTDNVGGLNPSGTSPESPSRPRSRTRAAPHPAPTPPSRRRTRRSARTMWAGSIRREPALSRSV